MSGIRKIRSRARIAAYLVTAGTIAIGAFAAPFEAAQAGKTYKYDELGRLIKVTDDAAAKQTVFNYDASGNRVQVALEASTAPKPSFAVNDVTAAEGSTLVFTVTKTGATNETFSVNYATANGTATAGSDYTSVNGTLTFFFNETTKTVSVPTLTDTVSEGNETALLNLSAATDGATIADSQGVGTITNVAPNQTPVAVNDSVTMAVFDTVVISPLANDYDPDGGGVFYVSHSDNSTWITETWNSSTQTMSIDALNSGSFVVTYVISDGEGGSATGFINVTVTQQ